MDFGYDRLKMWKNSSTNYRYKWPFHENGQFYDL